MTRASRRGAVLLGMLLSAGACDLVGLGHEMALVTVDPDNLSTPIVVPDTVKAGVAFDVRVTTISLSCSSPGRTIIDVEGNHAVVTLFDIVKQGDCLSVGIFRERWFELRFGTPGIAEVRIVGERGDDEVIGAAYQVVVVR